MPFTCTVAPSLQGLGTVKASKQVQGSSLKLPSGARGFSSLCSGARNHLVLGAIQLCNLDSTDAFPWPASGRGI